MADYADPVPLCLMCVHLNIAVGQLPSMEIAGRTDKVQMTMSKVEHRAWGKSRKLRATDMTAIARACHVTL